MATKTHHTAVAVVPPEAVWEPIQAIRRRYDRQINRWMPHVNLLYPFRPRSDFDTAARLLAEACRTIDPFTITLAEFRFFRHGSGRCTLWLAPEPADELRRLQAVLQVAFPDCDDLSNFPAGFTPHLSVGQFASAAECERTREQLQASWEAISFVLAEVVVLARSGDAPFVIERRVPLLLPG
jgi:2'-5' RNA ligase